jgi:hypothetical protein
MIANARMYSVNSETAELWRRLLTAVIELAGLDIGLLDEHASVPNSAQAVADLAMATLRVEITFASGPARYALFMRPMRLRKLS